MVCRTARSSLFEYLDGELQGEQRSSLEHHLASCFDCRRLVELERRFREAYVAPLRPDPVPERVREQVTERLQALRDQRPAEHQWRHPPRWTLLAGVAVLAFGAALGLGIEHLWTARNASLVRLAGASVEQHRKLTRGILPHDIKELTPKAAERWFKGRLDFNVSLPDITRDDLTFLGGRISNLRELEVAALHYRVEGKDVSLFIIPLDKYKNLGLGETPKFKMVIHQGYDVIVWSSHGVAYSLVSEIGGQSCLVCHSREERLDLPTRSRVHEES